MKSNMNTITKYLNTLYQNLDKGYVVVSAIKGNKNIRNYPIKIGDREAILDIAESLTKEYFNVYITNNIMSTPPIRGRGKEANITTQTSIVLDIDVKGGTHTEDNFIPDKETAIKLLPLEPTMIVDTGYGIQAYYIFDKPYPVDKYSKYRAKAFIEKIVSIAEEKGYKGVDSVYSLEHIFRLAGTFNLKTDTPIVSNILSISNTYYPIETFPVPIINEPNKNVKSNSANKSWATYFLQNVDAQKLSYEHWRNSIWICHSVGIDINLLDFWSSKDESRYTGKSNIEKLISEYTDKGLTIATLIEYIKIYNPIDPFVVSHTYEGYSKQLEYLMSDRLKYVIDTRQWAYYDNGIWELHNQLLPNLSRIAFFMFEWLNEHKPKGDKNLDRFINAWTDSTVFEKILKIYGGKHIIYSTQFNKYSSLLNVQNGVIDLQTGNLIQHNIKYLFTYKLDVSYYPLMNIDNIDIPNYSKLSDLDGIHLIVEFFNTLIPDSSTRNALLRFLGYCLTGETSANKALIIYGNGANGKSVLLKLLEALFQTLSTAISEDALRASKYKNVGRATTELNKLIGKRLGIIHELPSCYKLDTSLFKTMTSGDSISIRKLHEEEQQITFSHKLIMSGNHTPEFSDSNDNSMKRRILLIHFEQNFINNPDILLLNKLLTALPELLSLLVQQAILFYKEGLIDSISMQAEHELYFSQLDFISEFIEDYCVLDTESIISRKDVIKALRELYPGYCLDKTDKLLITLLLNVPGIELFKHMRKNTLYIKGIKLLR